MLKPFALVPLAVLVAFTATPGRAAAAQTAECQFSLQADVALKGDSVELHGDGGDYRFDGDRVWRNGSELALNGEQHAAADQYRRGLQRMVPAVSAIAVDGAMLGLEAVTVSFAALGGDAHDLHKYESRMARLSEQIHTRYNGRELLRGALGENVDDAALDGEIDELAEDIATDMSGNIASMVFTALVNPGKIEARADATERIVERRLQPKADALEARARPLCAQFVQLDRLETTLGIDAIEVEQKAAAATKAKHGVSFPF
ncbi:DUF2884 family protein [Solimonas soli]|uniref:DUF2884 family protein n=1 Tax=Solimonas soli TaxID=413479 RepID=UPI000489A1F5|nr:DUF2884 family protein [Solimonas soli]